MTERLPDDDFDGGEDDTGFDDEYLDDSAKWFYDEDEMDEDDEDLW